MEISAITATQQLKNSEGLEIKAGTLHLKVQRISHGWSFKTSEINPPSSDISMTSEVAGFGVSEGALYQTGESDRLVIIPAMPAKPVVLKNSGMRILPGQSMRFYVKIPVWLQFYHTDSVPEYFLTEYPLFRLSDTWFGEPDEGEPAFALGNYYQKDLALLDPKPWEAVCPVHIRNHSNLLLEVQRLIIRVENLALGISDNQMITSLTEIEYKGKDQVSSANYLIQDSIHGKDFRQLTPPRNAGSRTSSLKINFHFIKTIYQI
jgi:hypothetical protein